MIDYQKESHSLAVDLMNTRLTTPIRPHDVDIKDIVYLQEGIYNTRATLVARRSSAFSGEVTIEYDRLNLGTFFLGTTLEVLSSNQKLVSDYLPYLEKHYGLFLTEKDIVDGRIVNENMSLPFKFILKVKENNPAWYGQVEITVVSEKPQLRSIELRDSQEVKKLIGQEQATPHLFGVDFSPISELLSHYYKGQVVPDRLKDYLNQVSEHTWVIESEFGQPYNLANAKVLYNGKTEETTLTTNKNMSHVMVVELDNTLCENMQGYLLLHYNLSNKITW